MIKPKKRPRAGDIIMAHNYGLIGAAIRLKTNTYWNHCCLYLGNGKVLDIFLRGIIIIDYKKYYIRKNIEHKFIRVKGLSEWNANKLCKYAIKFVGKKYDFALVLRLSHKEDTYHCSSFIFKIFNDMGIRLAKDRLQVSPADIDNSKKTYDVDKPPNAEKEFKYRIGALKQLLKETNFTLKDVLKELKCGVKIKSNIIQANEDTQKDVV